MPDGGSEDGQRSDFSNEVWNMTNEARASFVISIM